LPSFGSNRPEGATATYHTVLDGETIWDIAKRHGVSVEDIKVANSIGEDQVIQVGQVLKVPTAALPVLAGSPESTQVAVVLTEPKIALPEPATPPEPTSIVTEQGAAADLETTPVSLSEFLQFQQVTGELSASVTEVELAESDSALSATRSTNEEQLALLPEAKPSEGFALQLTETAKPELKAVDESADLATANHPHSVLHRVGSGDTLWSIARSYGVEPDDLRHANAISDPNVIMPGEELVIPADASETTTALSMSANPTGAVTPGLGGGVEESAQTGQGLEEGAQAQLSAAATSETEAVPGATASKPVVVAASDPFVAELLADVANVTQPQAVQEISTPAGYADAIARVYQEEQVDSKAAAAEPESALALSPSEAVNPEFTDVAADTAEPTDSAALSPSDLLAAAPLGSEVYAPIFESPEGRVVTPSMPVLPGQDEYLPEAPDRFNGYIWPAQGVLTSGYGWRWGRMHRGVDIAGPVGTPIYSAGPGVVVRSGWNSGGYGNMVDIRHPDGSMTRYAHNSRNLVREGQEVRQGQQIAEMGSTGYSTGPHLHFEIHLPDQGTVNPMALLPGR
jgi:murein DD-endopeptidase MepM/ murein hydrolase activator NlpD